MLVVLHKGAQRPGSHHVGVLCMVHCAYRCEMRFWFWFWLCGACAHDLRTPLGTGYLRRLLCKGPMLLGATYAAAVQFVLAVLTGSCEWLPC